MPSSSVLSCTKPTAAISSFSPESSSSDQTSSATAIVYNGPATKMAVLDLLSAISCTKQPLSIDSYQQLDDISNRSIREIVSRFIPSVTKIPMSTFSQWLNSLPSAEMPNKRKRVKDKQVLVRTMWFLIPERQNQAAWNLFNKHMFIESVKTGNCKTIGYARKSHTNESKLVRVRLLEEMTGILVDPCMCSKIYVTPICSANSPLLERDMKRNTLTKDIRNTHGDMQDLISFAKTAVYPIRLVVIDYAGLTTSPQSLLDFVLSLPMIMFIVVYHGHKFESFSREALLKGDGLKAFECRKAPVRRSKQ